jgi:hypothetical protein
MTEMTCPEIAEQLPELLYGGKQSAELQDHLDGCPLCREEFARLEKLKGLLPQTVADPPKDLVSRSMAAVMGEADVKVTLVQRFDRWLQGLSRHQPSRLSWTAAAVFCVFLMMPVLYPNVVRFHSSGAAAACHTNVRALSSALEHYANDHHQRYPNHLEDLVPQYVKKIPVCPTAGKDTYSVGYVPSADGHSFKLECALHPE